MPCFLAYASARERSRAATQATTTSGCDLAGFINAMGLEALQEEISTLCDRVLRLIHVDIRDDGCAQDSESQRFVGLGGFWPRDEGIEAIEEAKHC
jgi:hypothetical protein